MNEQLLKDFLATAKKDNYNWDVILPKFPELKDYDLQLLKDYAATAKKDNYDYSIINPKFPEFNLEKQEGGEPVNFTEGSGEQQEQPTEPLEKPTVDVDRFDVPETDEYLSGAREAAAKKLKETEELLISADIPDLPKHVIDYPSYNVEQLDSALTDIGKREKQTNFILSTRGLTQPQRTEAKKQIKRLEEERAAAIVYKAEKTNDYSLVGDAVQALKDVGYSSAIGKKLRPEVYNLESRVSEDVFKEIEGVDIYDLTEIDYNGIRRADVEKVSDLADKVAESIADGNPGVRQIAYEKILNEAEEYERAKKIKEKIESDTKTQDILSKYRTEALSEFESTNDDGIKYRAELVSAVDSINNNAQSRLNKLVLDYNSDVDLYKQELISQVQQGIITNKEANKQLKDYNIQLYSELESSNNLVIENNKKDIEEVSKEYYKKIEGGFSKFLLDNPMDPSDVEKLQAAMKKIYEEVDEGEFAYLKAQENLQSLRFGGTTSLVASLAKSYYAEIGRAIASKGTFFNQPWMTELGDEMMTSFSVADERVEDWSDLANVPAVVKSVGRLAGSATTSIAVGAITSAATAGLGTIPAMAAVATASGVTESIDMAGNIKRDIIRETGSLLKGEQGAEAMWKAQMGNWWTYLFDGLPYVGRALRGVSSKAAKIGIVGLESSATETVQETRQTAQEQKIMESVRSGEEISARGFGELITPGLVKSTFLEVAPGSFFLGGSTRAVTEFMMDEKADKLAKEIIVKTRAGLVDNTDSFIRQKIFASMNQFGKNFTNSWLATLQKNGAITEEELGKLYTYSKTAEGFLRNVKGLNLTEEQMNTYFALSNRANELYDKAESITDDKVTRATLTEQANALKKNAQDFLNNPETGGSFVSVKIGKSPAIIMNEEQAIEFVTNNPYVVLPESGVDIVARNADEFGGILEQMAKGVEAGIADLKSIDDYGKQQSEEGRLSDVDNTLTKINNAEYINDSEIDAGIEQIFDEVDRVDGLDISDNAKESIKQQLFSIAETLDNYEFRTKTETRKVTPEQPVEGRAETKREIPKKSTSKAEIPGVGTVNLTFTGRNTISITPKGQEGTTARVTTFTFPENFLYTNEQGDFTALVIEDAEGNQITINDPEIGVPLAINNIIAETAAVPTEVVEEFVTEEINYIKERKEAAPEAKEAAPVEEVAPTTEPVETATQRLANRTKEQKGLFGDQHTDKKLPYGAAEISDITTTDKNGVTTATYVNPETKSVDAIITATNKGNFVGYVRVYENGKPTDMFTAKMQASESGVFKNIITSAENTLPDNAEVVETTTISTGGLKSYNKSRLVEKVDEDGNVVTRPTKYSDATKESVKEKGEAAYKPFKTTDKSAAEAEIAKIKEAYPGINAKIIETKALPRPPQPGKKPEKKAPNQYSISIDLPVLVKPEGMKNLAPTEEAAPVEEVAPTTEPVETTTTTEGVETTTELTEEQVSELNKLLGLDKSKRKAKRKGRTKKDNQRLDKVERAVDLLEQSLSEVMPNIVISVAEDSDMFARFAGEQEEKKEDRSKGLFTRVDGTYVIVLNPDSADVTTVFHEGLHAVLVAAGLPSTMARAVTARMVEAVKKTATKKLQKELEAFTDLYKTPLKSEEYIAELIGILANNYNEQNNETKSIIRRWLQKLAEMLGLKPKGVSLSTVGLNNTDAATIDALNFVAKKMSEGGVLTEQDLTRLVQPGEEQQSDGGEETAIRKQKRKKPKNIKGLLDVMGGVFGLNKTQAESAAVVGDVLVETMAKRAGVSKEEMYQRIAYQKGEENLPQGVKLQVDAFHGSPYLFDKFTTEKMGTGEGQQAFGWGLYFTDIESIAQNYAEKLGGSGLYINGGEINKKLNFEKYKAAYNIASLGYERALERQLELKNDNFYDENTSNKIIENIKSLKDSTVEFKKKGVQYKVSLHKGKTPDQYTWLEWDKGVNRNLINLIKSKLTDEQYKDGFFDTVESLGISQERYMKDGETLYNALTIALGSDKAASLFLLENGIDGIKYPAESISRGATSDTARGFNYVVFDENAVSIEEAIKFQKDAEKARGAAMVNMDGTAIIYALTDPNVSTPLHELAHVYEHYLTDDEIAVIERWSGHKAGTVEFSEKFARGFEKFLAGGKVKNPRLQKIFENFKKWLTEIYNGIKGSEIDIQLNSEMESIYNDMLGAEEVTEETTVEAPVKETVTRKQRRKKPKSKVKDAFEWGMQKGVPAITIKNHLIKLGYTEEEITSGAYDAEKIWNKDGKKVVKWLDYGRRAALSARKFRPQTMFLAMEAMESSISAELRQAKMMAENLNRAINKYKSQDKRDELIDAVDEFMRDAEERDFWRNELPDDIAQIAEAMRVHIDSLSLKLVYSGVIKAESSRENILGNIGVYMNRSFEIFDNENWKEEVSEQVITAAQNYLREAYYNSLSGISELDQQLKDGKITESEYNRRKNRILSNKASVKEIMDRDNVSEDEALTMHVDDVIDSILSKKDVNEYILFAQPKVGKKDLSSLKRRKDIPPAIRALMGEYTDPGYNYAMSIFKIANLVENQKYLTKIRDAGLGVWLFEKEAGKKTPEGYEKITFKGDASMNPLDGLYAPKEVAKAFNDIELNKIIAGTPKIGRLYGFWLKSVGAVKYSKTILSYGTHAKNVIGNMYFMAQNGYLDPREYQQPFMVLVKQFSGKELTAEQEAKMDEWVRAGIIGQGATIGEIKSFFEGEDSFEKALTKRIDKKTDNMLSKARKGVKKFGQKAQEAYQYEDDMFKIVAYEKEKLNYSKILFDGKSYNQLDVSQQSTVNDYVAEIIKNILPNYGRIGGLGKGLKAIPITGTFISFQIEAYRTAYNTVALAIQEIKGDIPGISETGKKLVQKRGVMRLISIVGFQAFKYGLISLLGIPLIPGDDDDEDGLSEKIRTLLPFWDTNSDISVQEVKPNGNFTYVSISASDPYGSIFKVVNATKNFTKTREGFSEIFGELAGPFVSEDILLNTLMNIKNNENDYGGKIVRNTDTPFEASAKIALQLGKTFEPGAITSTRKIIQSENKLNEALGQFTGFKLHEVKSLEQAGFKFEDIQKKAQESKSAYNSIKYNMDDYETQEDINKVIRASKKAMDEDYQEAVKLYQALISLGVSDRDVKKKMYDYGISAKMRSQIARNSVDVKLNPIKK